MAERAVAVLVFGGGEGRRMGGDKPAKLLLSASLIERALTIARGFGQPIAVGVRHAGQVRTPPEVESVVDAPGLDGPLGSLAAGLRWARERDRQFLLTLPCDAPLLPDDLARRLVLEIGRRQCAVVVPQSGGRLHPACALWRVDAESRVAAYARTGRRSLTGFAAFIGGESVEWRDATPDPFFNVNTPTDLERAAAFVAQPHLE